MAKKKRSAKQRAATRKMLAARRKQLMGLRNKKARRGQQYTHSLYRQTKQKGVRRKSHVNVILRARDKDDW